MVVEREMENSVIRMWGVYSEKLAPRERRIFGDIDVAREWFLANKKP